MKTEKRITVWPDDTMPGDAFAGPAWIVSRDDESSDTIAIFEHRKDAEASGRKLAKIEGLPLYYQDEQGVATKIL